ncbi:MAG: double-cubane-cluster-containing anaerobic reductase [Armatimonadota bacterium]
MSDCCKGAKPTACCAGAAAGGSSPDRFDHMIENCLAYATAAKAAGRPIVGITCEYSPRELIMAAGGVPVCLCGGSEKMVSPAERDLPSNLCPLIKSTYGYHLQRANPFLEMADLIIAETTCDGKKKMFELMADSRPLHVLELPQKPDDPDSHEHWYRELLKLKVLLEQRFSTQICDERLRGAIRTMNRERRVRRELAELMTVDVPPLTGGQLLKLKSSISGIPEDLAALEQALERLRAQTGSQTGRVRVLLTGVPIPHGAERPLTLIEEAGGLVVCQENCTGLRPLLEDVDETASDPLRAIAEKYFHLPCSVMTRNSARLDSLRMLVQQYRPQCIIELIWQACLTYDVESYYVRKLAEELGLPYLRIETDYSPADSARIKVRVEALFETVRG